MKKYLLIVITGDSANAVNAAAYRINQSAQHYSDEETDVALYDFNSARMNDSPYRAEILLQLESDDGNAMDSKLEEVMESVTIGDDDVEIQVSEYSPKERRQAAKKRVRQSNVVVTVGVNINKNDADWREYDEDATELYVKIARLTKRLPNAKTQLIRS